MNDVPQRGARNTLRALLGDLTAVPAAPEGYQLRQIIRAPIYSGSVDIAAVYAPNGCTSDTCEKRVEVWRWSSERHQYEPHDTLPLRGRVRIASRDLTHDGLDELLITDSTVTHVGYRVLGVTAASHVLVARYERDSIVPALLWTPTHTALIEQDSVYSRLVSGVAVPVPKKYFAPQGEFYLEAPSDTNWAKYLDRVHDSVRLILSLTKEEMRSERHPDPGLQTAFVRSSIANALLDTSWYQAQRSLASSLNEFSDKLSSANYQTLARLSLCARASHFVRVSAGWNPQLLQVLGDLDDAVAMSDTTKLRTILQYIYTNVHDPNTLIRAANALLGNDVMIPSAERLLARSLVLSPTNASALRSRAAALAKLGYGDSSRALLVRSLQFDSTSSEARQVRRELEY